MLVARQRIRSAGHNIVGGDRLTYFRRLPEEEAHGQPR
jgi:hypothetical protein